MSISYHVLWTVSFIYYKQAVSPHPSVLKVCVHSWGEKVIGSHRVVVEGTVDLPCQHISLAQVISAGMPMQEELCQTNKNKDVRMSMKFKCIHWERLLYRKLAFIE